MPKKKIRRRVVRKQLRPQHGTNNDSTVGLPSGLSAKAFPTYHSIIR